MIKFNGVRRTSGVLLCLFLAACGGGGGGGGTAPSPPAPAWTAIPDFTITADGRGAFVIDATEAKGVNFGDGVYTLECTVTSHGYWALPSHLALITRADTQIAGSLWGSGLAIGKTGDVGPFSILEPRAIIETWALGAGPLGGMGSRDSILYQDSQGPILIDAKPYPVMVQNIVKGGARFVRYTMDGYDSGQRLDVNTLYDPTKTGLIIADAFRLPGNWSVAFEGCRYHWSAE